MQDKADGYCYLCARLYGIYDRQENLQEHHVIFGRANRKLSEKYGLKVYHTSACGTTQKDRKPYTTTDSSGSSLRRMHRGHS